MLKYIVICQQIIGNSESGFKTSYEWDGDEFDTMPAAKKHGFKIRESDDFNIATINGKKLVGFYWMDKQFEENDFDRTEIEEQLGLTISE